MIKPKSRKHEDRIKRLESQVLILLALSGACLSMCVVLAIWR